MVASTCSKALLQQILLYRPWQRHLYRWGFRNHSLTKVCSCPLLKTSLNLKKIFNYRKRMLWIALLTVCGMLTTFTSNPCFAHMLKAQLISLRTFEGCSLAFDLIWTYHVQQHRPPCTPGGHLWWGGWADCDLAPCENHIFLSAEREKEENLHYQSQCKWEKHPWLW